MITGELKNRIDGLWDVFAADGLQESYDAVHAMGVLEKDGTFTDSMEQDGLDGFPDIRRYHVLQYYEIFGKE